MARARTKGPRTAFQRPCYSRGVAASLGTAVASSKPHRLKGTDMSGIVVGVDGSTGSHEALGWAAREAAIRHVPLTVVTVNPVMASAWTGNPVILPPDEPAVEHARAVAEEAAGKATSQLGDARPTSVTVRAVSGFIAEELISASRDAEMLVVGSRGAGGFAALRLGSVSSQVVHHASCPVVIIPADR